jgi:hypothetical protein
MGGKGPAAPGYGSGRELPVLSYLFLFYRKTGNLWLRHFEESSICGG